MIKLFNVFMAPNVAEKVNETLYSGYITQGPKVEKFEQNLRDWLDVEYLLTVNSCTSALQLAAYLAGVRPGVKVISTPMTCSATNSALVAMGAYIIWADINPKTGNIDPNSIEDILRNHKDIKAIMMVHWGGYPCDIYNINVLAHQFGCKTIEDAAHAFGATYGPNKVGHYSDFVCFSFQAIKHLTTIDGGLLVCKNKEDYEKGKLLRWYGLSRELPQEDMRCEQDIKEFGWKYHMNDVNATIGLANLKHIDYIIDRHIANGLYYDEALKGIPGIELIDRQQDRLSSYWIYTILGDKRNELKNALNENGIMSSEVHSRNDKFSALQYASRDLPGLDEFSSKQVSIPCGWWVKDKDRDHIVKFLKKWGELYG